MDTDVTARLCALVGKPNAALTESGDAAIAAAIALAHALGRTRLLTPDQGGWNSFRTRGTKLGMIVQELRTDYGITDLADLERKASDQSALIVSSMAGYFAEQPMERIAQICAEKNCLLINDASGTIGTPNGCIGDVILCSFGKGKPINLGYGGCIASANSEWMARLPLGTFDAKRLEGLARAIDILPARRRYLTDKHHSVVADLKDLSIIHPGLTGFNVIVRHRNPQERQRILAYCRKHAIPWHSCPRAIRVLDNAISIEIKRLREPFSIGEAVVNAGRLGGSAILWAGKASGKAVVQAGKASVQFGAQLGKEVGGLLYSAVRITIPASSKKKKTPETERPDDAGDKVK